MRLSLPKAPRVVGQGFPSAHHFLQLVACQRTARLLLALWLLLSPGESQNSGRNAEFPQAGLEAGERKSEIWFCPKNYLAWLDKRETAGKCVTDEVCGHWQGFMTGALQAHARRYRLAIDTLSFGYSIKSMEGGSDVSDPPVYAPVCSSTKRG